MSVRPAGANTNASDTSTEELAKAMSVLGQDAAALSANSEGEPVPAPTLNSEAPAITRNLVVSIRASLNDLVQESSAAKWQPTEGALNSIFKQRRFTSLGALRPLAPQPQGTHARPWATRLRTRSPRRRRA